MKPPFTMIGANMKDSIDLLREIANMSACEKVCFFTIRDNIRYDATSRRFIYQVKPDFHLLSNSDKAKFRKGFKLLEDKDLVRRVSLGVYMINPKAIIPNDFQEELSIWNSISK